PPGILLYVWTGKRPRPERALIAAKFSRPTTRGNRLGTLSRRQLRGTRFPHPRSAHISARFNWAAQQASPVTARLSQRTRRRRANQNDNQNRGEHTWLNAVAPRVRRLRTAVGCRAIKVRGGKAIV